MVAFLLRDPETRAGERYGLRGLREGGAPFLGWVRNTRDVRNMVKECLGVDELDFQISRVFGSG